MYSQLRAAAFLCLIGYPLGGTATATEADRAVSQAAKDECQDMVYESMRRNCEVEFMEQPRILRAESRMKELLDSLQAKMRSADSAWSKGPINDGEPKYVDAFNAAQKAWEEYAEQTCLLESFTLRRGTDQSHHHWGCNIKMKETRIVQLETWEREF
jgi:uncharacterized protein YecT (DUF1311 family)